VFESKMRPFALLSPSAERDEYGALTGAVTAVCEIQAALSLASPAKEATEPKAGERTVRARYIGFTRSRAPEAGMLLERGGKRWLIGYVNDCAAGRVLYLLEQ
jgi:hypothetical protein